MSKKVFEYISKKSWEKILSWHNCIWCDEEFPLFEKEKKFLDKNDFPVSELCFDCRIRNMIMRRNDKKLFWRKSDKSWKKILSLFSDNYNWKVYDYSEYDKEEGFWNINFQIPESWNYLETYYKLLKKVPRSGTDIFWSNENIWYCNRAWYLKNSYYSFRCFGDSEDIYFSAIISGSKDVYNSSDVYSSSIVSDSVRIHNSYKVFHSDDIHDSKKIYFCYDLKNCEDCIFSSNQVWKKYLIFNKQYSEEEYNKMKNDFIESTWSYNIYNWFVNKYYDLLSRSIKKATNNIWSEKSFWDQLDNSKSSIYCFWVLWPEDCINSHIWFPSPQKSVFSSYWFWQIESMYFSSWSWPETNCYFSMNTENWSDTYHSQKLKNCKNSLFCFWIQDQEYSIFNKRYEKEEYKKNFQKIKNDMIQSWFRWKFFSPEKSPFTINDTILGEDFPLRKIIFVKNYNWEDFDDLQSLERYEEILDEDWKWDIYILEPDKLISKAILDLYWKQKMKTTWRTKESEVNIPEWIKLINYDDLVDDIMDVDNTILEDAIICKDSKRPFRIVKKELEFYKKYNIPLPRIHPDIRIKEKNKRKPKIWLYLVKCNKCNEETLSVHRWDKWYKIYCESCYNKEIY